MSLNRNASDYGMSVRNGYENGRKLKPNLSVRHAHGGRKSSSSGSSSKAGNTGIDKIPSQSLYYRQPKTAKAPHYCLEKQWRAFKNRPAEKAPARSSYHINYALAAQS